MTHRKGKVVFIEETPPGICAECGATAETRPYGEGGAEICFPCGMKNEERTIRALDRLFRDTN